MYMVLIMEILYITEVQRIPCLAVPYMSFCELSIHLLESLALLRLSVVCEMQRPRQRRLKSFASQCELHWLADIP